MEPLFTNQKEETGAILKRICIRLIYIYVYVLYKRICVLVYVIITSDISFRTVRSYAIHYWT